MIRLTSVVLPAPVGPDDGDGLARLGHQRQVADQRAARGRRRTTRARTRPGPATARSLEPRRRLVGGSARRRRGTRRPARPRPARTGTGWPSRRASVRGWVNWREYWMKAWTSPMLSGPEATRSPPMTAMSDVVEVADQHHQAGWMIPEMNWAPKLASKSSSLFSLKRLLDLALAPERLDDGVAGEGLLDQGVERAGVLPLRHESDRGALGDEPDDHQRHGDA